jgi:cytochrome c5
MSKSINQTFGAKIAVLVAVAVLALPTAAAVETDPETGRIIAPGWDTVKTNCTACHSARFITWQRGDRETWLSMIRWMQKTQGLWQLKPATENTILDYLATNYPPGEASRRKNLPPAAMPANN